jgi:hypothetical protein
MKKIIFIFWMFLLITATLGQKEYFGKGILYTSTIIIPDMDDFSHSCKNGMLEKEYLYKNNQLKNEYNRNTETEIIVNTSGTKYSRVLFSVTLDMVDVAKIIIIGILIILGIAIVILIFKYFLKDLKLKPDERYFDYLYIFINIIWTIYLRQTFYDRMNGDSTIYTIAVAFGLFFVLLLYWRNDSLYKTKYVLYFIFLELVIELFLTMIISSSKINYSYNRSIDYDKLKNIRTIFGIMRVFLSSFLYQSLKKVSYRVNRPPDKNN